MDYVERIFKEATVRMMTAEILEPLKERLKKIGVTLEYKVSNIDVDKLDNLANQHQKNQENGDSVDESICKILGEKPAFFTKETQDDEEDSVTSDELLEFFKRMDELKNKGKNDETTKTDN